MALRAVVFDYGMVLTNPPHPEAHQELRRLTGLSDERFEDLYWVDRLAYDRGDLSGIAYWTKIADAAGLKLSDEEIAALGSCDARMWTSINPEMIAWHTQLKERGLRTGILSNMGDLVLERILESFAWVEDFDVLVWSYQHSMVKPDEPIYRLILEKLGTAPEETLFLDDKLENIEGARRVGMLGIQFTTVEKLREDLAAGGFTDWLPLP